MDAASPCLQGMRCFGWCSTGSASCIAGRCSQRTSTGLHLGTHGRCARGSVWKALRRIAGTLPLLPCVHHGQAVWRR